MHRQSSPSTPVLLLYQFETEMAYKVFIDYANKKQNKPVIKTLTENTAATEKAVKRIILKGMTEVCIEIIHVKALIRGNK